MAIDRRLALMGGVHGAGRAPSASPATAGVSGTCPDRSTSPNSAAFLSTDRGRLRILCNRPEWTSQRIRAA